MPTFLSEAEALFPFMQTMRRDLHQHPELGFQEFRTAGIVAKELNALGMEVSTGIAHTGVMAILEGSHPGPVVMLRFDMDALPIHEETGAQYASQTPGVMHACGHDGHVTVGLSAAKLLSQHKTELPGTIKFVFQPAEEGLGGAEGMIAQGVLENPRPDYALGLHIWNEKPYGWIGITPGPLLSAAEIFKVKIFGRGGHGGIPDASIDPIAAASQIVVALQTIVARNVSPFEPAVISVTYLRAGETTNVIPPQAELWGTIRTFDKPTRAALLQRFHEIIYGVAGSLGCRAEINLTSISPAVVNDAAVAQRATASARRLFPELAVDASYRSMVAEDMAYFLNEIPGCFLMIGSANPDLGLTASHHHPKFDFDERAMVRSAALIAATAFDLCSSGGK